MKIYRIYFGQKLGEALRRKGLTQLDFAEKVGVEPATISRWVNGRDFPHEDRVPDICNILGIGTEYFLPTDKSPSVTVKGLLSTIDEIEKENETLKLALELEKKRYEELYKSERALGKSNNIRRK